jgi:superfamily II RNA helicase
MVMEKEYEPAIFFTFGRRGCENLAMQVNHLDLTGGKKLLFIFFLNYYFNELI